MSPKRKKSKKKISIKIDNISAVSGNLEIAGRDISEITNDEKLSRIPGDSTTDAPPPDAKKKKRKRK